MAREDIKSVLVIGSGPIVIGQAAEFDYAGTQACRALREEGKRVILVNSNPATIMTDEGVADVTYIEPLTVEVLRRVIERERPDGILATLGGQTGLNLAVEAGRRGHPRRVSRETFGHAAGDDSEGRGPRAFPQLLLDLGLEVPLSRTVTNVEDALAFSDEVIGLPAVIRPAYTLGGTGGGIARNRADLERIAAAASPPARSRRCWSSSIWAAGKSSSTRSSATRR